MAVCTLELRPVLGCLFVAVFSPSALADAPKPEAKKAPPALCRFTLGAIFEASDRKNRDRFLKDCALDLKQVVKAFDQCKLTVVKTKLDHTPGERGMEEDLELVVEGKERFVLKDADQKDLSLKVTNVKLLLGRIDRSKAPTRYTFRIGFDVKGLHTIKLLGLLEAEHRFTWCFASPGYCFDAQGRKMNPGGQGRIDPARSFQRANSITPSSSLPRPIVSRSSR